MSTGIRIRCIRRFDATWGSCEALDFPAAHPGDGSVSGATEHPGRVAGMTLGRPATHTFVAPRGGAAAVQAGGAGGAG